MARPRLFALPCGVNFPRELVAGVLARHGRGAPQDLARVTIYLNTGRMLRAVRSEFDRALAENHADGAPSALLLPRLRLMTALADDPRQGLGPAVPPLRRRLELAQLLEGLIARQPDFAPGAPLFALAESLAGLMAEMQDEGVTPDALEALDVADHAAHWQRSLAFIRIVARYFDPTQPDGPGLDAEARQRLVAEGLAQAWAEAPPPGPVIAAGSTGSRGATSLFLQAVAGLDQGAVVLPGFDFDLPAPIWRSLTAGPFAAEDHPQYRHLALAKTLGLSPADIAPWTKAAPADGGARNRLISLALRPAPVTDQWLSEGASLGDLGPACAGLSLIEAPDPRAEALAIALALRQGAEQGLRGALVTPDRLLSRRVAAALDRWGVLPDDSAGLPLILSPPGRFLRHVADLFGKPLDLQALLVLLKHPLTHATETRGDHLRLTREIEIHLRAHGPAFPDAAALIAWAARRPEPEARPWAAWLARLLPPAQDLQGPQPLAELLHRHLALAEALTLGPDPAPDARPALWREEAGRQAQAILAQLAAEAPAAGPFTPRGYGELLGALLDKGSVRIPDTPHPLIAIWGTLEARVQGADLVILGGLNEGSWPQQPPPDPWLSRKMRAEAGLTLPERRIGLQAHDFQQAVAAPRVILSRARRDAEAETVTARWLNRLVNLMGGLQDQGGPAALQAMRARGAALLALAKAIEAPETRLARAPRPSPCPPLEHRPRELAVTGIRNLIRDPYTVYARKILRLYPMNPIGAEADARLRGQSLHRIVEEFVKTRPQGPQETLAEAQARLLQIADRVLDEDVAWPSARRFWRQRLARVAPIFLGDEARRATRGQPVVLEEQGSVPLPSLGFRLTARPDRIDLLPDGRVHIYDYKSGKPPTKAQQAHFEKQLLLEAAMAERGGFATLGPRAVEGVTYIGLGGDGGNSVETLLESADIAETWAGLHRLLRLYLQEGRGFTARRASFSAQDRSDYDHLSRLGEWDVTDPPHSQEVGP